MNGKQLKNSILQLAIQGKLVPQNSNDEPASELLKRIRKEKEALVKAKKIKKEKPLPEITDDEKPFEIPESWEWVRWGALSESIQYGYNAPALPTGRIKMVRISDIQNNEVLWDTVPFCNIPDEDIETYILRENDILFARTGGTVGKSFLVKEVKEDAIYAGYLIRTRYSKSLCPGYLKIFMESPIYWDQLRNGTIATAQPNCNGQTLSKMVLPLPPLAEQKRIVAKIEELMPIIDEYDKAQTELDKLNAELPERLKKSVLQEAIQGKLDTNNPADEPASELLKRIRKEKEALVKAKKIKKEKPLAPITDEEKPFEIPESWEWVRLGEVTYNHGQKVPDNTFSYIDIGSIDNKLQKLNKEEKLVEAKDAPSRARKIVEMNDIIYSTVRPYLHNMCIIDKTFSLEPIASTGFAVLACTESLYFKYLFYYLLSPDFDEYANDGDNAKGIAYPAINDKKLYNAPIPLPPLAEQKRIVEKLDAILPQIENIK